MNKKHENYIEIEENTQNSRISQNVCEFPVENSFSSDQMLTHILCKIKKSAKLINAIV